MMTAIDSSGGMAGVSMIVSGPQPTAKSTPAKLEEVLFFIITLHTSTKEFYCGERMELVPVNFYLREVSVNKAAAFFLS